MYMNGADVCMSIVSPVIAIDKCRYYYFVFIYKNRCVFPMESKSLAMEPQHVHTCASNIYEKKCSIGNINNPSNITVF